MSFLDINIKKSYRTPDNIIGDFYIPLLSRAKSYDRAVGFFSSSILIELSRGLIKLIKNGGKMRLITSPNLSEEDIEAINNGYASRDEIIKKVETAIMDEWKEPKNHIEEERLNFLSHLIEEGYLDIKIAFKKPIGLYHEKIGIITDAEGNSVAFIGSLNESKQASRLNFESIDAYTSWGSEDSLERVNEKIKHFEETWNNLTESLEVIEFPKVAREKLKTYKKETYNQNIDQIEEDFIMQQHNNETKDENIIVEENTEIKPNVPQIPPIDENFKGLYDYQKEAIDNWANAGYRGIFDMATGTGKTLTALGAITRLYNDVSKKLAVVICCPYIHLITQWCEDLEKFNIIPIIGYGKSPQTNWKEVLKRRVNNFYNKGYNSFFCFITTNTTFRSTEVQEQLKKLNKNTLLVADEAHNLGAKNTLKCLPDFEYRLGLSATINRHGDIDGTQALYDYFGSKSIEYDIERAIKEKKLTPYEYKPHLILLNSRELDKYKDISNQLSKYHTPEGQEPCAAAKILLIQRARILASAQNKIPELKNILKETGDYRKNHLLIYCGDSNVNEVEMMKKNERDELEKSFVFGMKQITAIKQILANPMDLNMKIRSFTSKNTPEERTDIKKQFIKNDIQAIIAIKCLDEGVNIPAIETAYILASTTNPKEYIQRRGRVLRKFPGKEKSIIHDFIVMPCLPGELHNFTKEQININKSIIYREIKRMKEFASISLNPADANRIIGDYERIIENIQ